MPEAPLSELALYAARPTLRVNGADNERASGLLVAMDMVEREEGLSTLELRFTNVAADGRGSSDFAFEDETDLKLGDRIGVYSGDENAPTEVFSGFITALEAEFSEEAAPVLVALAEDKLQSARMKRRTRTYDDQSIADIARTIAQDLGLTPTITGFTQPVGVQVQLNESDLAFLRRLLTRYDGDLQVVGEELHVSPRAEVQRGTAELRLHSQLRRARLLADLSHQVNEVTVTGWDAAQGQRITGRSSSGNDRGPGRGRSGSDLLSETLGRRLHQIGHLSVSTSDEAEAIAAAAFDERRRRFVTAEGTSEGNPAIRVGTHVTLSGLGPRFSNTYYVVRCRHRFDRQRGYETDFTAECAFIGEP
jgi:phage protein D